MNIKIKNKISQIKNTSTNKNAEIASYFLNNDLKITRIKDISDSIGISLSAAHRFIKKLGYPTFAHFKYDYNSEKVLEKDELSNLEFMELKASSFGKIIGKKKINIITSVRGKSVGKFLSERLNDANISNQYLSHTSMDWKKKISSIREDIILLIDISGYSNSLIKAFEYIEELGIDKMNILSISSATIKNNEKIMDSFCIDDMKKTKHKINTWEDYNDVLLEVFKFINVLLKQIYINNKKEGSLII